MKPWFEASLAKVSKGGKLGKALRYGLRHWDGLCRFLDDGRIEIDSNCVERSIRGLALTRKNALFAGHDQGAMNWAMIASLLETCKLNRFDPLAWLTDVLTKLVNLWPASKIDDLMPWAYTKKPPWDHRPGGAARPLTKKGWRSDATAWHECKCFWLFFWVIVFGVLFEIKKIANRYIKESSRHIQKIGTCSPCADFDRK
jgi:hypothetical protein